MNIVAFRGPGKLELDEAPDPTPGEGEVVVAVAYCGICGSDIHEYVAHDRSPRAAGMWQPVMGHELSGVVARVGSGVQGLREGDPVVVHPGDACGGCPYCRLGQPNLCINPRGGTGYSRSGGYGQYVCITAGQALPIPDAKFLKPAALSEPFGVALHAVNRGGLRPGESVFVTGAGPIGALSLLAARHKGAGTVIVSEPSPARRELAQRLGADVVLDPGAGDLPKMVREHTGALGADLAVECVGRPRPMDDCFAAIRRGGRIVVAGTFDVPHPIDLVSMLINEYSLIGSLGSVSEIYEAVDLICSATVDVSPIISDVIALADVPGVFADVVGDRNTHNKVLVHPNDL
jgi:(R,R)-butanediol dehydrogenase/meso-butanediol dehydrogenase/diacetyl reductase